MASTTVMQFTDRLFLSHYSLEAVAAAAFSGMASLTVQMTLQGICSYATVQTAQYAGARALYRVGPAMWQGIWCALFCSVLLIASCFAASPLFEMTNHEPLIIKLEIQYFVILTGGSSFALLGAAVSSFFYGRGCTKPIMIANIVAALVNIPLNYLLIFGVGPFPEMGIVGAGMATVVSWIIALIILSTLVFRRENNEIYNVLRGWRLEWGLFKRLVRFGLPNGTQLCVELAALTWFMLELGNLGRIPQAASSIVFAVNGLTFLPMLGLSMATSTLVGQAMGRKKPLEAELVSYHALHLAFIYMVTTSTIIVLFAGNIMDIFKGSGQVSEADFAQVRATGTVLLYYVALYSLVDSVNLAFMGTLKGSGDTLVMMKIIITSVMLTLIVPMIVLRLTGNVNLHSLWILFTSYVFILAVCITIRFKSRKWHKITVIENMPPPAATKQ
jgi:MATE family multidrug resistance protein